MEEKNNKKVMALGITLVIVFVIYTVELVSLGIIKKNEGKRLDENGNVVDKNNRDEVDNDEKSNDNNHSKIIYFYSNNNDLLWLDYNSDKKSEYDTKYELLNKYTCNDDMCSVLVSDGTCGAGNINYTDEDGVFIIDGNKINYYDYKENKVVYSYDALKTSNSENFSTYDEGYIIYHGDASNKSALLGLNGKILSNYYDSIIGTTKSYSNNHRVASYQINDKYGILSGDSLKLAIYLFTAHLLVLQKNIAQGQYSSGIANTATVDKVSVSMVPPPSLGAFEYWLNQTQYGSELLALLSSKTPLPLLLQKILGLPLLRMLRSWITSN